MNALLWIYPASCRRSDRIEGKGGQEVKVVVPAKADEEHPDRREEISEVS